MEEKLSSVCFRGVLETFPLLSQYGFILSKSLQPAQCRNGTRNQSITLLTIVL